MAAPLYRKMHNGREFARIETVNRVNLRRVTVHHISGRPVSRDKWNEELAKAVEAEGLKAMLGSYGIL